MDMKKLLETVTKFAGQAVGQKPGEQWKGTDSSPPGKKLVGDSILKDLSKGPKAKTLEEELAEAFGQFNEDDLGVEEKRPGRTSDRPHREYTKHGKPSKRYNTVKSEELNIGDDVIITGPVEHKGETGVIDSFGQDKRFVVVNLYNHGKKSFHSSDVSYNDYAGSDEEEAEMYDRDPEFRDWAAKQDVAEGKLWRVAYSVDDERHGTPYDDKVFDNPGEAQSHVYNIKRAAELAGQEVPVIGYQWFYPEEVDEGVVDTIRKANYNRLADRSFKKAYDAHQDALDAPKTPAERRSARAEFNKQYDKGVAREKLAKELGEGWESGPEERAPRERDPDWEYDQRRQEKADAEAQAAQAKRPQTKVYTLTGRGPNMEPNYKFPGEYASQAEADAARTKLMADPKTPNPRMIGISVHTKYLGEGIESADPVEGAVLKAVQELIQQGHTEVAPEVITNMVVSATSQPFLLKDLVDANKNSPAIQHYVDSINPTKVKFSSDILTVKNENPAKAQAQAKQKAQTGVSSMASRAANRSRLGESKVVPVISAFRRGMEKIAASDMSPQAKQAAFDKLSAEFHKNSQAYSDAMKAKRKVTEYGANQPQGTAGQTSIGQTPPATQPDPKQVAAMQQATQTLKTATQSTAPAPNIAKALDAASQGKPVGQQDMTALKPMMQDLSTVAQDPKLAGQFKTLASQIQQAQQKQQSNT